MMATKQTAPAKPHFQTYGFSLVFRKFSFLVTVLFFDPHLPLKYFQKIHRAITMGRTDQGAGIDNSITLQAATPIVLTRNPDDTARNNMGSLFQAFMNLFVFVFWFI